MAVLGRSRSGPPPLIKSWIRPCLLPSPKRNVFVGMFDEVNTSDPYIYFVIVNSIANLPKQFFKVKASYLLDKAHFHGFFIVSKALYNHINPPPLPGSGPLLSHSFTRGSLKSVMVSQSAQGTY